MKVLSVLALASFFAFSLVSCGSNQSSDAEGSTTTEQEANSNSENDIESEVGLSIDGYALDVENSKLEWKGVMMKMYTHIGKMRFVDGVLAVQDGALVGTFQVDMTNLDMVDENFDPSRGMTEEKLVGHIMSKDFFDSKNSPTAQFSITSHDGGSIMKGDLTIKGTTIEQTVEDVVFGIEGDVLFASGKMKINRKDYSMSYEMGVGDMVIGEEVEIMVNIAAR